MKTPLLDGVVAVKNQKVMSILAFAFEQTQVRFIEGEPIGTDVAEALGYSNKRKAISTHVSEKNKSVKPYVPELGTRGQTIMVTTLKEAGIYQLIFKSKLPNASIFQDWVFEEVLPSIRKTGQYSVQQYKLPENYIEALEELLASKKNEAKLEAENKVLNVEAALSHALENTDNTIEIGFFAQSFGIGRTEMYKVLRILGFIQKESTRPYEHWRKQGYFKVVQVVKNNRKFPATYITGKGEAAVAKALQTLGIVR